jgi:hypothetical protein
MWFYLRTLDGWSVTVVPSKCRNVAEYLASGAIQVDEHRL